MTLRLSTAAARGALVLFSLVLAAGFAYSGVRSALASYYGGLDTLEGYQRAARLEPADARNWYLLGRYWQYNLEEPDTAKAILAYQKSLSLDPHSTDAWSDLATAYESENNLDAARDAFLQAKRAYPLSPEVSWRYGNFLLRRGQVDLAFAEFRHAVEVEPKRAAAAFALCMRVDPNFSTVVDRVLPASQDAYLSVISALVDRAQTDQALVLWSKLMDLHPHLAVSDSFNLIEVLFHKLQMTQAQNVWEQVLAASDMARPPDSPGSLVWDGGFESSVTNGGFAWRYHSLVNGVQIGRDPSQKHSGYYSLRLTFNGLVNVSFNDVCQYVAVQPSTKYQFSAWVQTRSVSTDQGLRFSLHSVSPSVNAVAWTDDIRDTHPWTLVQLPWTSGADVRQLQLCVSRRASAKFDSKIRGTAWVDDVSLVPVSVETPKQ